MTAGKARDDGYRGVHVGSLLRQAYEAARIRNGDEFREALKNVLSDCEKI